MPKKKAPPRARRQPAPDPTSCLFHGLRRATPRQVSAQSARYWEAAGGLPRPRPDARGRIVCRNLTFEGACGYLSMVNQKILESGKMQTVYVVPFVVAWYDYEEPGQAAGFPIEVWMVRAQDDRGRARGLWDILDNSNNLHRLPWMWDMGWITDRLPGPPDFPE